MEKRKEKRKQKKDYPFDRVHSRTTVDDLKINVEIKGGDGVKILGEDFKENFAPIRFDLKISRADCLRLHSLITQYPDHFVARFEEEALYPALLFMNKNNTPGKFKDKGTTLYHLKSESADLYELFSFCINEGREPSYFKKLVKKIDKVPNKSDFDHDRGLALTALCMECFMNKTDDPLNELGIRSFIDRIQNGELESFYNHFVKGTKACIFDKGLPLKDLLTQNTSDEYLESLAEEPPFNYIFKSLQLI
jgi:hypothetical protein